jgi:ribose 5-phosphate isomerase B
MKIGIGNDHTAVALKQYIQQHLLALGHEVVNYGTDSSESFNYPDAGEAVALGIVNGEIDGGVLICGTGIGISLAANKVKGIRAAVCSEPYSARMAKEHNACQIIAFGARVVGDEMAKAIVDAWLEGETLGGRHAQRVAMIMDIERRNQE